MLSEKLLALCLELMEEVVPSSTVPVPLLMRAFGALLRSALNRIRFYPVLHLSVLSANARCGFRDREYEAVALNRAARVSKRLRRPPMLESGGL